MVDKEEIRRRNPIEDVVARFVTLRGSGKSLTGKCPFHDDSRASFVVWPDIGYFRCYAGSCGVEGDVFTFVELMYKVDFREACRILGGEQDARPLPKLTKRPPKVESGPMLSELGPKERQALGLAHRVYHSRLMSMRANSKPRRYLAERCLTVDDVRRFGIGYCTGKDLLPAASFAGVSIPTLQTVGLVVETPEGGWREWLAHRVILPDRDPKGVSYLMGRALSPRATLKYLGLKGVTKPIMGLDSADPKRVTVVLEGIFCAYSLRRRGLQTLAVMGTALRGARAQQLQPFGNIIFVPQNDEPDEDGVRAGDQAVDVWCQEVGKGRVVRLPESIKDVNDLDQAGGLDDWLRTWATWLYRDRS